MAIDAIFIISFGPQSRGVSCDATMSSDETAASVGGQVVSAQDYTYAFRLMGGGNQPPQFLKLRRFKLRRCKLRRFLRRLFRWRRRWRQMISFPLPANPGEREIAAHARWA